MPRKALDRFQALTAASSPERRPSRAWAWPPTFEALNLCWLHTRPWPRSARLLLDLTPCPRGYFLAARGWDAVG
jgi:hypothetical protein